MSSPILHPVLSLALAWVAGRALPLSGSQYAIFGCIGLLVVARECDRSGRGRLLVAHALLCVAGVAWPSVPAPGCTERAGAFIATVERVEPVSIGARQPVEIVITAERARDGLPWRRASIATTAYLDNTPSVLPGDRIQFRGEMIRPVETRNPSDFDVAAYRRNRGWSCRVRVTSDHAHRAHGRGWATRIAHLRAMSYRGLDDVEEPTRSILRAIALGARSEFPVELRDRWSRAGFAHLLAISGLHVTLVFVATYSCVAAVSWMLARSGMGVLGWRKVAGVFGASASLMYCIWAGSPASAVRAASMLILLTLCRALAEAMHPLQALALVASLMIGFEPEALSDVGFWLSVSAVAALVAAPSPTPTEPRSARWTSRLMDLSESLVAPAIATAPICAAVFRSVAWASPFTNVIALPLGTFALTPLAL
ncbi:MAG: ComEC/Rec2 family competence protein, partial [Myxococcota bacterium]